MYKLLLQILLLIIISSPIYVSPVRALGNVGGKIVLQVEENGEAWYISPGTLERYFLGRPNDAFALMREQGIGISDADLEKIPLGLDLLSGQDSDRDGLPDEIEKSLGTNYTAQDTDNDSYDDLAELKTDNDPRNDQALSFDPALVARSLGKIFLQVEAKGQAWYVFPENGKRYFLGRPMDAFDIMRKLGLGITNNDLNQLVALTPNFNLAAYEKRVHDLVNQERLKNDLPALIWNDELAAVAREHSQSLANENKRFTALDSFCTFPLIHHEGLDFGLYHDDRLTSRGVMYYSMSGENIALLSSANITLSYQAGSVSEKQFSECSADQTEWDKNIKESLENETDEELKISMVVSELTKRQTAFEASPRLLIESTQWQSLEELAHRAVDGWMNSPGHRRNILQSEYDEAGMGAAYVNSYIIITQVFIKRTDCGYAGAACCEAETYEYCYKPNTCTAGLCQLEAL